MDATSCGNSVQTELAALTLLPALSELSDHELLQETVGLAARQRQLNAQLVAAISEVEARRLYVQEGFPSMHAFCTKVLRLSEHAAYTRIGAARLARQFPEVLERLADGSLTLTNAIVLAPYLNQENHAALLEAAAYKSKHDVKSLVAQFRPSGTPELYTLQITISREAREQLREAQNLLAHSIPDRDVSKVLERAIAVLLANLKKKQLAETDRPRESAQRAGSSRHIPARVKRRVWKRDGGQCTFVGPHGRCDACAGLQFHHIDPYAQGGRATVGNIQLRCGTHNRYQAQLMSGGSRASPGGGGRTEAPVQTRAGPGSNN